jgi:hypothetical protein
MSISFHAAKSAQRRPSRSFWPAAAAALVLNAGLAAGFESLPTRGERIMQAQAQEDAQLRVAGRSCPPANTALVETHASRTSNRGKVQPPRLLRSAHQMFCTAEAPVAATIGLAVAAACTPNGSDGTL